ncbi:class I SAM-dependent methyltransferase [Lederbergia wuyishanensis]|uniref:2-polyprenyl-3-methyl-5-hydroxy-6-metoxy-1, 4-benzoquinol methylase n=1 Tax=Lederbergia wuyishanensis TaxID=1347903 RepID=A0ABU0CYS8_9BACI|nr:class I SAM-dependent methyltransferase [Lederbergia wuyishanensis]MCJ8005938.1 methyltransferase domain-containing protein [Lederbergia wuyishanensis]MDQ0341303.1 2-polyprenyl-3-methyl-5-hydroxy-6-metoxy-1,4-benzoquinol methylase [Lederbergia wuyishanensis]
MSEWKELNEESKSRWNENAEFWDDYMGNESNRFHREIIRPHTEKILEAKAGQTILDIACGNGNFSRWLAEKGVNVVAIDYSPRMIERARLRSDIHQIDYKVLDATNIDSLIELGNQRFDSAVANMALMDIANIQPLMQALTFLLKDNGIFVFSIPHPCFQSPNMRKVHEVEDIHGNIQSKNSIQIFNYLTPQPYKAIGIKGQPTPHYMFHRPLSYYLNLAFKNNFVLDGIEEPSFLKEAEINRFDWYDIPPAIILRLRKTSLIDRSV